MEYKFKNKILIEALKNWDILRSNYNGSNLYDDIYGFLKICDVIAMQDDISDEIINDFVIGLSLLPKSYQVKDERLEKQIRILTKPMVDRIVAFCDSDSFVNQRVGTHVKAGEGLETVTFKTTNKEVERKHEIPIDPHSIVQFIRDSKSFVLLGADVIKARQEYIRQREEEFISHPNINSTALTRNVVQTQLSTYKLKIVYARLQMKNVVNSVDEASFLGIFSGKNAGRVHWNERILGAKAGLFDLMERLTNIEWSASNLKQYFVSGSPIHDNWNGHKNGKLIDEIMSGF
jgi:hypothetical protein